MPHSVTLLNPQTKISSSLRFTRGQHMSKPNILFITADFLSAKALSIYGHKVMKAPAIQGLADCGLVYEAAYCNSPFCGP